MGLKIFGHRIFPTIGTGRHKRRRAEEAIAAETEATRQSRLSEENKKEREKKKAMRIKIRALRRAGSSRFFDEGSETIG